MIGKVSDNDRIKCYCERYELELGLVSRLEPGLQTPRVRNAGVRKGYGTKCLAATEHYVIVIVVVVVIVIVVVIIIIINIDFFSKKNIYSTIKLPTVEPD